MYDHIRTEDADAFAAIDGEEKREADGLELIPSENYASKAVREAMGSALANKYAEGYPGKRYYGGQEFTDQIETLAIQRAKQLFGASHANVQPLGGAAANLAFYMAALEPGDTILGMDLSHGGHLTHGHPATLASKIYRFVGYKMKDADTGAIDYDELLETAKREKPKVLLAGFSAYPRELDWARLRAIADEVGALAVADVAHIAGLIAGGAQKNPFDFGFDAMTMTTHKTLRGPRGGMILVRDGGDKNGNESSALAKKVDKAVFPGVQGGPHMNQIAAKAVAFGEALRPSFKTYAAQVVKNAAAMAQVFNDAGVRLIGGGTSNHLVLADVSALGLSGGEAETLLDRAGITTNKNVIADDARGPLDPSGVRFGTPALTTRGFTEEECGYIAQLMLEVMHKKTDAAVGVAREKVRTLAQSHPIPDSFL